MSSSCIVYPCRRRGGFCLPLDPDLRLRWLEAIKWPISPLEPKRTATVCPTHFTEVDFIQGEDQLKRLKNDAVPSVFPWNSSLWSKEEVNRNASSRSPSTDEEQEVDNVEVVIDKDEANKGSSSPADKLGNSSHMAANVEILSISSDNDAESKEDDGLSPVTVWEPSPAGREPLKRSAPRSSSGSDSTQNGGKRRRLEKRPCSVIVTTSKEDSSSSNAEEPPKAENPVISAATDDDGAESDGSDCILCEKPVETVDLTSDTEDTVPAPGAVSLFVSSSAESDSRDEEELSESLPSLINEEFDDALLSEDSDCEIIEKPPPTIEINSDDEALSPATFTPSDGSRPRTLVFTKIGNETYGRIVDDKGLPSKSPVQEVDPFAGVTCQELDPLADVPSEAAVITYVQAPPAASSSGHLSPVAPKEPSIQKSASSKKAARSLPCDRSSVVTKEDVVNGTAAGKLPRGYEVVGIFPNSKALRIILMKKKNPMDVSGETQGCVDPVAGHLQDSDPGPSRVNDQNDSVDVSPKQAKNVRMVNRRDLVPEESHLESVALYRGEEGYEPHCDKLVGKLFKVIHTSRVMVGLLSQEAILSMYNVLFLSEISYGVIYWGHCEGAHKVFDLQKRFVAMLAPKARAEVRASRATFIVHGLLTLPSIYILHCLIHVHKNLDAVINRVHNYFYDDTRNVVKSVPTYEIQGLEFYMALPLRLRKRHCGLTTFISVMKKFLKQTAPFNALEYYDMILSNPQLL